jgi:hypothetical protein
MRCKVETTEFGRVNVFCRIFVVPMPVPNVVYAIKNRDDVE